MSRAVKPEFRPGSLWIGGEDNYVVEILGNGHKPGLKRVQSEGGLIIASKRWSGRAGDGLRHKLQSARSVGTLPKSGSGRLSSADTRKGSTRPLEMLGRISPPRALRSKSTAGMCAENISASGVGQRNFLPQTTADVYQVIEKETFFPPDGFGVVCVFTEKKPGRGIAGLWRLFHKPCLLPMASRLALMNSSILGW